MAGEGAGDGIAELPTELPMELLVVELGVELWGGVSDALISNQHKKYIATILELNIFIQLKVITQLKTHISSF